MLTEEQIAKKSQEKAGRHILQVFFAAGATWANEQNAAEIARWQAIADDLQAKRVGDAAEIARLRTLISDIRAADIKNKIESGLFSLPKEIRERIQDICEK